MGGSLALQWRPDDATEITFDALFSRFKVTRWDNYIDALSFARNTSNNGQPMVSVVDLSVKPNGSLLYGLFNGVDLRSESLRDKFTTTFGQANLNIHHKFTDKLAIDLMAGYSKSIFDNPERLTVNLDAIDTPGYSIDFRGGDRSRSSNMASMWQTRPISITRRAVRMARFWAILTRAIGR
jgi:hypothetical protein